eukprot:ctg_3207.g416
MGHRRRLAQAHASSRPPHAAASGDQRFPRGRKRHHRAFNRQTPTAASKTPNCVDGGGERASASSRTEMASESPPAVAEPMLRLPQLPEKYRFLADPHFYARTFVCVGPVCLASGVGFGLGFGCGAGIGQGWMPVTMSTSAGGGGVGGGGDALASLPLGSMLSGIPGGYYVLDLLRNVLRRFPGARPGLGCGVGLGYGVGIGLRYG